VLRLAIEPAKLPSRRWTRTIRIVLALALVYAVVTYLVVPFGWKRYAVRHPELEAIPRVAYTGAGIPADPLNVELIGPEDRLKKAMVNAHWYPADPLTFRSCLEIAEASVLKRPYDAAPVSSEYLFGRREDLAFEKPVGDNPRERHHVRFWRAPTPDSQGRTVWIGSAIFDKRVGLSRTTGQFTHLTAPDVDTERDYLFQNLQETHGITSVEVVDGFHQVLEGKNGEGVAWKTDGRLFVGLLGSE
jgi:LssY C-terminus